MTHQLNDSHLSSISIFLQSKNSNITVNENESDIVFFLDEIISAPPDTNILISCIQFELPYSFYNIDVNNNKIVFNNTTTITLPAQNYDVDSLVVKINQLMSNANLVGHTLSFNEHTNKFTFASSANAFAITSTTMGKILGLNTFTTPTHLHVCSKVCNLAGSSSVYICLNNLNIQNIVSDSLLNNTIAKCQINCSPGEYIFLSQNENQYFVTNTNSLSYIHLQLRDDEGQLLNLNGGEFSVTFNCVFSKKRRATYDTSFMLDEIRTSANQKRSTKQD